jgi:hypothetical protein
MVALMFRIEFFVPYRHHPRQRGERQSTRCRVTGLAMRSFTALQRDTWRSWNCFTAVAGELATTSNRADASGGHRVAARMALDGGIGHGGQVGRQICPDIDLAQRRGVSRHGSIEIACIAGR